MKNTKDITLEELKKMVLELQNYILSLQVVVKTHIEWHMGLDEKDE